MGLFDTLRQFFKFNSIEEALAEAIDLPLEDSSKLDIIKTKPADFKATFDISNTPSKNGYRTIRYTGSLIRAAEKVINQEQQQKAAKQKEIEQKRNRANDANICKRSEYIGRGSE